MAHGFMPQSHGNACLYLDRHRLACFKRLEFSMAHSFGSPSAAARGSSGPNQPTLDSDEVWQARVDLAACFRMAARLGLEEGICNHFSAVVPGYDDLFIVNPYGLAFRELTASKLLICDFHGNVLSGDGQPEATAFYIHARIHRNIPRARVAFHTHMPYATALAMTEGDPLIFAGQTALKFYGRMAFDQNYNGLALDEREGDRIAAAIGDADIVFMKHHGVMVLGPNVAEAWDDLYYVERACQVQTLALSTGRQVLPVDPAVAKATYMQMREGDPESARLHLASIKRTLDVQEREYRE
jgi:ribulose-5-phosphate 4-epimerase/fuculose-1-phosphate aldolase